MGVVNLRVDAFSRCYRCDAEIKVTSPTAANIWKSMSDKHSTATQRQAQVNASSVTAISVGGTVRSDNASRVSTRSPSETPRPSAKKTRNLSAS